MATKVINTYMQACFLVPGPPNFGLSLRGKKMETRLIVYLFTCNSDIVHNHLVSNMLYTPCILSLFSELVSLSL